MYLRDIEEHDWASRNVIVHLNREGRGGNRFSPPGEDTYTRRHVPSQILPPSKQYLFLSFAPYTSSLLQRRASYRSADSEERAKRRARARPVPCISTGIYRDDRSRMEYEIRGYEIRTLDSGNKNGVERVNWFCKQPNSVVPAGLKWCRIEFATV